MLPADAAPRSLIPERVGVTTNEKGPPKRASLDNDVAGLAEAASSGASLDAEVTAAPTAFTAAASAGEEAVGVGAEHIAASAAVGTLTARADEAAVAGPN